MSKRVLGIYCAGGFGGVTLGLAERINELNNRWDQILFIEDDPEKLKESDQIIEFAEFKEKFPPEIAEIVTASGETRTREVLFNKVKEAGYSLPNLIHPFAECAKNVKLGEGNLILGFAYVSPSEVVIDNNNIVMPYAQVSHNNHVCSHCIIASSANLSGTTVLNDRAYVGTGAKLRENITVGADAIIGMGAIVTKSVDGQSVVVGTPAKEIRKNTGKIFKNAK